MTTLLSDMVELVERFNREILDLPIPEIPTRLSDTRKDFGLILLQEELNEFILAETLEDEADALVDLAYVALGRLVEMGIAPRAGFEEVHTANMRKKRGTKSTRPMSLGCDAIKPDGWAGPDWLPYTELTRDQVLLANTLGLANGSTIRFTSEDDQMKFDFNPMPKILVIGHARHGKDTVAEIMRDNIGLSFTSSSEFLAKNVIYPALDTIYGYTCWEDCFEDRFNHRDEWFNLIREYNTPDNTRLARAIVTDHDIYCGMRSHEELQACKDAGIFDAIVWVHRPGKAAEPESSCSVTPEMADYFLSNDGDLTELSANVDNFVTWVYTR